MTMVGTDGQFTVSFVVRALSDTAWDGQRVLTGYSARYVPTGVCWPSPLSFPNTAWNDTVALG